MPELTMFTVVHGRPAPRCTYLVLWNFNPVHTGLLGLTSVDMTYEGPVLTDSVPETWGVRSHISRIDQLYHGSVPVHIVKPWSIPMSSSLGLWPFGQI